MCKLISSRYIYLSVVLLCGLCVANIGCAPKPDITATATAPGLIDYGQVFDIIITVSNNGNSPAKNLYLYCRANPSGYFATLNADRPKVCMLTGGFFLDMGDLYPGEKGDATVIFQAPRKSQIDNLRSKDFEVNFTSTYDNSRIEKHIGSTILTVGQ